MRQVFVSYDRERFVSALAAAPDIRWECERASTATTKRIYVGILSPLARPQPKSTFQERDVFGRFDSLYSVKHDTSGVVLGMLNISLSSTPASARHRVDHSGDEKETVQDQGNGLGLMVVNRSKVLPGQDQGKGVRSCELIRPVRPGSAVTLERMASRKALPRPVICTAIIAFGNTPLT
ncbi:hypothetical protein PV04_10326 [Phialophora macrospora]|uniref:Uncharacterized protein n=1 Tax=Phialophora macrospora TaxID=1851006 RepID=A0A0D2F6E7_9EURO|nr:hypothetical protein PV04_10326 [Phialophora macrospora]